MWSVAPAIPGIPIGQYAVLRALSGVNRMQVNALAIDFDGVTIDDRGSARDRLGDSGHNDERGKGGTCRTFSVAMHDARSFFEVTALARRRALATTAAMGDFIRSPETQVYKGQGRIDCYDRRRNRRNYKTFAHGFTSPVLSETQLQRFAACVRSIA
ncbi:hypothetical protein OE699_02140 [Sedimentimonas flavescens]|uniref:Uncharacterized protein n=1 Tax=Sedimentimonas flavescens TaxID=2851012 RepID=A0ABT2ZV67_9RHOB|nr:hypothetical protein [Sedimentimonas flavescens]MCV2877640.1 hypothetical protein [Sedimentimonas flavescens]